MIKNIRNRINGTLKPSIQGILLYSVLWGLCVLVLMRIFNVNGKTFLYLQDGAYQHFISFNYLCDYIKELIYNQKSVFFDFTLGQGMDILTTLNCYDFTDPISILCTLLLPLNRVGRYTVMIFVKLYLVGFSFLFYCHSIEKNSPISTATAALAYAFSGAVLFSFARHPNYINWAYFLPFILGGAELYFRKGQRVPLVLFVFLNMITSYYTFYMNAILTAIYVFSHVAVRLCRRDKTTSFGEEAKKLIRLAGVCSIGILLSAVILFPTAYAYLNNARIAQATGYIKSLWHYPIEYYLTLIESLFAPYYSYDYYTHIGLNIALFLPIILLFLTRKKNQRLKILLLLCAIMLCIPLAGRVMNGFGYASNRWCYAVAFYASVAFVTIFSDLNGMSKRKMSYALLITIVYISLCYLHTETNISTLKSSAFVMLAAVTAIVFISLHYQILDYRFLMIALVLAGSFYQIYFTFSTVEGNYVSSFLDKEKVESSFAAYSSSIASDLNDEFYRVEMLEERTNVNEYNNVNGTGFWWSMVPSYVMDYYTDLSLDSVSQNCNVQGLDGRTGLLAAASVKYYTRPTAETGLVPYGYEEMESSSDSYQVFENQYALPVGYTYAGYITTEEYNALNGIEKEQALLQGAILETAPEEYDAVESTLEYETLDYEVVETRDVSLSDGIIEISNTNGTVIFSADVPEDCEIYVYIKGIELADTRTNMSVTAARSSGEYSVTKSANISNLTYSWAVLRDDVSYNLGYGYEGENTITLSFGATGTITYDDIQIIAVPMSLYRENVEELREYVLENVTLENDTIMGTLSLPESRILQLSVPYSDGWTAYIDGEETEIIKSNVMYMAVLVSGGDHVIELYYQTPYLKIGLLVSIITAVFWGIYEVIQYKKTKEK